MTTLTPRSCGFLIVRGNPIESFLLMKHADRWDLPKGHVDPGETDEEAALRELVEETGIREEQITILPKFCFESRYMVNARRYGGSGRVEKTMRIYVGRLEKDVTITPTEHLGYKWFKWNPPHTIQKKAIDPLLSALQNHLQSQS